MQSLTYKDLIDEKVAEWKQGIQELEKQAMDASDDMKEKLTAKLNHLRSAVDGAIIQLYDLDKHETVDNTVETKDKILDIFTSVDKDFTPGDDSIPYML